MTIFQDAAWWPAPAKLNLMLRILGRRADGYHSLQTVFQFVDLMDYVHFELNQTGQISRRQPLHNVPEAEDLTLRAAHLLRKASKGNQGVTIDLKKNIPMGGGLGGGSSNAATTLVALNHLWNCGLSTDALAQLGLQLGADVPVFIRGFAAWAEGVGEQLTPIVLPEIDYIIIHPGINVATASVFSDPDLTRNQKKITPQIFLCEGGGNVCQSLVSMRFVAVQQALDWLHQKYKNAQLTGTGACVFSKKLDNGALPTTDLPNGMTAWNVKGLNFSPLLEKLRHMK